MPMPNNGTSLKVLPSFLSLQIKHIQNMQNMPICQYVIYAKYANTYTRIEAFNKASTSAAFLGTSAGDIVLNLPEAALFIRK
jgi:hypothetical protein